MDLVGVDEKLVAAFAADGVVCVRGVLDAGEVAAAARGIDAVLAGLGPLALVASGADDPGTFTEDFCRWRDVPEIGELARHSRAPAIAAAIRILVRLEDPACTRHRPARRARPVAASPL